LKFFDIDKIKKNSGVSNKYLLTTVVAARARSLSEDRGSRAFEETGKGEKVISIALSELESDKLSVKMGVAGEEGGVSSDEESVSVE
jgi:DNA-directed RNA polymerase omega subunit